MAVPCPVCEKNMHIIYFLEIELDFCKLCGGLWFDGGEMDKVIGKRNVPRRLTEPLAYDLSQRKVVEGKRQCPRCRDIMKVMNYKDVNVDVCLKCKGIWLDRYELAMVMGLKKELRKIKYVEEEIKPPGSEQEIAGATVDFARGMFS